MEHKGSMRFLVSAVVAGLVTIYIRNDLAVPDDWREIVSAVLVAFIITIVWFIVRAIQHGAVDLITILGAVLLTVIIAPPLVGWTVQAIEGNPSWHVDIIDIIVQYPITLLAAALAKVILSPKLREKISIEIFKDEEEDG